MTLSGIFAYFAGLKEKIEDFIQKGDYSEASRVMQEYKESSHRYFPTTPLSKEEVELEKRILAGAKEKMVKETGELSMKVYHIHSENYGRTFIGHSVGITSEDAIMNFPRLNPNILNASKLDAEEVRVWGFKIKVEPLENKVNSNQLT